MAYIFRAQASLMTGRKLRWHIVMRMEYHALMMTLKC